MRVELKTEGGMAHFPGLSQPTVIDTAGMPPSEADELEQRVQAANFFQLPAQVGQAARGAADYRRYTITVEKGGQRHTIQLIEPVADPDLEALLNVLRAKEKELRAARRASGRGSGGA